MNKRHLDIFHMRRAISSAHAVNVNQVHAESLSRMDRIALAVTNRVGTFGTFLAIAVWTILWLGWNVLAPPALRFDPAPAFVFWLFVSNLIQISLMPLIMTGQSLQSRHSEIQAEADHHITQESFERLERIEAALQRLEAAREQ